MTATANSSNPLLNAYNSLRAQNKSMDDNKFNNAELRASDAKSALRVKTGQAFFTSLSARTAHQLAAYQVLKAMHTDWVDPGSQNTILSGRALTAWSAIIGNRTTLRVDDLQRLSAYTIELANFAERAPSAQASASTGQPGPLTPLSSSSPSPRNPMRLPPPLTSSPTFSQSSSLTPPPFLSQIQREQQTTAPPPSQGAPEQALSNAARSKTKRVKRIPTHHMDNQGLQVSSVSPPRLPPKPSKVSSVSPASDLVQSKDRSLTPDACVQALQEAFFGKANDKFSPHGQAKFLTQLSELVDLAQEHKPELLSLTVKGDLHLNLVGAAQRLLDYSEFMTPRVALHVQLYEIHEAGLDRHFDSYDRAALSAYRTRPE